MRKGSKPKHSLNNSNLAAEPRVGIFWLFNGNLIIDSTPVSQG